MKSIFAKDSQQGLRTFILVIFSIALMVLDTRMATMSRVRNTIGLALSPLQYFVSWPIQLIDDVGKIITSQDALLKENINLKAQQLLLKAQVQRLLAIETENNQLKALYQSAEQLQVKVLIAKLLAVNVDPLVHQVVLNKGSRENVYIGQPVLDERGVMGKVIQVGPFTSHVLLLNDPRSAIPVQIARNGIRAIAMGDNYTGKLRLVNIPQTVDIAPNDVVMTSGLSEHYPEGYPVGQVIKVIKDPGLQFSTIIVEPVARLDRAREVLLVWPNMNKR